MKMNEQDFLNMELVGSNKKMTVREFVGKMDEEMLYELMSQGLTSAVQEGMIQ